MADTEPHRPQRDETKTQNIEATNPETVTEAAPQPQSTISHESLRPTGSAELPSKAGVADEEDSDFDELDGKSALQVLTFRKEFSMPCRERCDGQMLTTVQLQMSSMNSQNPRRRRPHPLHP